MKDEQLNFKFLKYNNSNNKGFAFILNRINYNWKELKNFTQIENTFLLLKLQKHINCAKFKKPTLIPKIEFSIDDVLYEENNIMHLSICLPCYDEEWSEVSGTLRSLCKNILVHRKRPNSSFKLHVSIFIIQDGWNKASESLREGIVNEFGCPSKEWIDETLKNDFITIILPNSELFYPIYQDDEIDQTGVTFNPIFITKFCNFQKSNSHLIFFSLCYLQNPDFVFLTDTGTIYNSDCLHLLLEYLYKKHDSVIAVTAKQRVMNETTRNEIQNYPYWNKRRKRESFCTKFMKRILWWLSPAPLQGFEFESSFLLNTSMFNIIGVLPVLPGPCQLLWWEYLKNPSSDNNSILDVYFDHLNMDLKKSNIIKANTLLAEDRILSFSMVLRTFDLKTIWVKDAIFSYEPMLTWTKLFGQRRRWINGTISTFLYYLIDKNGRDELLMSALGNNRILKSMWFVQLYQSILQIFSPSFFCIAIFESILQIFKKFPFVKNFLNILHFNIYNIYAGPEIVLTLCYFGFYFLWILTSIFLSEKSNNKYYKFFMENIYYFYSIINLCVSLLIFFSVIISSIGTNYIYNPMIYLFIISWVIPFFLSLALSPSSGILFLIYSIPFFLNICQYVCFIPTFALCRMYDLSWGNRDSKNKISKKIYFSFFLKTIKINFLTLIINFSIVVLYIVLYEIFNHSSYIYIPFFIILLFSIFLQIIFTIIYFFKIIFKSCFKCKRNQNDDNKDFSVISSDSNSSKTKRSRSI